MKRERRFREAEDCSKMMEKRMGVEKVPPPVADEILRKEEKAAKGQFETKRQQNEPAPPVFESIPPREDGAGFARPTNSSIAPRTNQPKRKWLLAAALALVVVIAGIWLVINEQRTVPVPKPIPTPTPTPTPTPKLSLGAAKAYDRGQSYAKAGNYSSAITEYTEAIKLKSDYADAFFARSRAFRNLGNIEKADADAAEAGRLKVVGRP